MNKEEEVVEVFVESFAGTGPIEFSERFGLQPNNILIKTTPYHLTFDEQTGDSVVSVPAGGTQYRNMSNDKAGMFDARYLKGTATSQDYSLLIRDNEYQMDLSNRQIHSRLIVGNNNRPFRLPIPLYLGETQSYRIQMTDLSGAPNDIRLAFQGMRYYFDAKEYMHDNMSPATKNCRPYFYTTDEDITIAVGAGTAEQFAYVTFKANADFYLQKILAYSTGGAFRIRMSQVSTGMELMNGWLHSGLFAGDAQYNYEYNPPMLFQRKDQMRIRIVNLAGVDNTIYLCFAGYNAYYTR